jgi:uncharacterized protein YwgA
MIKSLLNVGDVIEVLGGIPDRLALQKTIYLLQKMGLDFGYHYKWYTLGPYSSDLANDMFEGLSNSILTTVDDGYRKFETGKTYEKLRRKIPEEITESTKELVTLRKIVGKDLKNSALLECMGSLLFLKRDRYPRINSKGDVFLELDKLKPGKFGKSMKNKAWTYLEEIDV